MGMADLKIRGYIECHSFLLLIFGYMMRIEATGCAVVNMVMNFLGCI